MNEPQKQHIENILTLKQVILSAWSFIKTIILHFYVWVLLAAAGAYYQYTEHKDDVKKSFVAKLSFMLNDQGGSAGASSQALMMLNKEFGIGGMGGGSAPSEKKLVELLRTKIITRTTLFKTATINNTDDLFINHFQKIFNTPIKDSLNKFENFTSNTIDENDRKLNTILNNIIAKVGGMINVQPSSSGIITVTMSSTDEEFIKEFLEEHMNSLSEFYINRSTQKLQENFGKMNEKLDSIKTQLRSKEEQLASMKDKNTLSIKAEDHVSESKLMRDVALLGGMYAETVKNTELTKYNITSQAPLLQIIDTPTYPLTVVYISTNKYVKLGAIGGFLVGIIIISLVKIVRDALKEN